MMSQTNTVKVISASDMHVEAYNLGVDDDAAKIAYCRREDQEWMSLDCGGGTYYDVVVCDQKKTLFALGAGLTVEAWDLKQAVPTKKTIIQGSCPRALELARHRFPTDLYDAHAYLASTPLGQLFLVVIYDAESLQKLDFLGFRLDLGRREWIQVKSCNFAALFGGKNIPVKESGLPPFGDEVVYYSDDYWESVDGFSYGVVDGKASQQQQQKQQHEMIEDSYGVVVVDGEASLQQQHEMIEGDEEAACCSCFMWRK